jgi:hypothetical protein
MTYGDIEPVFCSFVRSVLVSMQFKMCLRGAARIAM